MFEGNQTWRRYSRPAPRVVHTHLGYVPSLDRDPREDRRRLSLAVGGALLLHGALFLVSFPGLRGAPEYTSPARPVYVLKQVRFQPPPPRSQTPIPTTRKQLRTIPVPDPTPHEPEPVPVDEEVFLSDLVVDEMAVYIPDAPSSRFAGTGGDAPYQVGGDVTPPVKIHTPSPNYTEDARLARIQGVVILQAIIDALGNVQEVDVLKGLPSGLTESAVETAKQWKFRPALRNGVPVPVYFNLTVRFSLQ